MSLTGCFLAANSGGDVAGVAGADAPPVKSYSAAEQARVAAELKACGEACRATREWIKDYHVLSVQVRAAR